MISMPPYSASRRRQKSPPPGETGQETLYLRFLSEKQVPVIVKLRDGEAVQGWIEYFDDRMIRLTREGKPNLFIYKHQIRTITEAAKRDTVRNRLRQSQLARCARTRLMASALPTIRSNFRWPRGSYRG